MHKHMKGRKINKAREQTSARPDMNFNGYLFMHAMFIVFLLFTRNEGNNFQVMTGFLLLNYFPIVVWCTLRNV